MKKTAKGKGLMSGLPMLSIFGPTSDAVAKDTDEARATASEDDGSALAERRTREAERRGKEKDVRPRSETINKRGRGRPKGSTKAAKGEASGRASVQTYVRLPEAMLKAVDKAVEDSPIEFGSASEFIRRAVETELRRRGLLAAFK